MEFMEDICLQNVSFLPALYFRYVDILLTAKHNKINEVLETFNNFHPTLKFTVELKKNNNIAFSDTCYKGWINFKIRLVSKTNS